MTSTTTIPAPSLSRRTAVGMAVGAFALGAVLVSAVVVLDDDSASTGTVQPAISGADYEASADARKQSSAAFDADQDETVLHRSISAVDHADLEASGSLSDRSISAIDHAEAQGRP